MIAQTRSALTTLRAAEQKHRAGADATILAVYEGTVAREDHLMRPGQLRTIPVRLEIVAGSEAGASAIALRETFGTPPTSRTETTLVLKGRLARQPAADRPFAESEPDDAKELASHAAAWLPSSAIQAALAAAPSCRPGPAVSIDGAALFPITHTDAAGRACTLLIDEAGRVARIERLWPHQRLGDVCDWTAFQEWEDRDGLATPATVSRFIVRSGGSFRYDLSLVSASAGPAPAGAFALPEERRADIPDWGAPPPPAEGFAFIELAPAVWSVEIAAADVRVLVIQRAVDLVLLGTPEGDAVCGGLVTALADRFPGKPIGVAAFGHHHPSPSGGLRALAAAGATIIAPRELEPYVRGMLSRNTTLGPPAVPAPAAARLEFFEGETTIDCGEAGVVRLIDIGERSAHAFRYVVFYLPGPGILFEDDLGYFPEDGSVRIGPRLVGLVEAMNDLGVVPERLIQLWPVRAVRPEVPWPLVADLVRAEQEKRRGE